MRELSVSLTYYTNLAVKVELVGIIKMFLHVAI